MAAKHTLMDVSRSNFTRLSKKEQNITLLDQYLLLKKKTSHLKFKKLIKIIIINQLRTMFSPISEANYNRMEMVRNLKIHKRRHSDYTTLYRRQLLLLIYFIH